SQRAERLSWPQEPNRTPLAVSSAQMTRPAVCGLALEARINVRRVERGKHRSGEATPENEKGPPFGEPKSLCLWCRHQESNPGPTDYKSVGLSMPADLRNTIILYKIRLSSYSCLNGLTRKSTNFVSPC